MNRRLKTGAFLLVCLLGLSTLSGCGKIDLVRPQNVVLPPVITSSNVSDITRTAATININVTGLGSASTVYIFLVYSQSSRAVFTVTTPSEIGTTTTGIDGSPLYEIDPVPVTKTGPVAMKLTGLYPDMPYSLRFWVKGDGTANGPMLDFRTAQ